MQTNVHLTLDTALVREAEALGPLQAVIDQALRAAVDPETRNRRRRWAEDNALLIEAVAGGAEEAGGCAP